MVTDLLYNFILRQNSHELKNKEENVCVRDLDTRFVNPYLFIVKTFDSIKCVYPMYFVEEHQLNHAESLC